MTPKKYPIDESSTYTSKTKQYNVRLPLEWVPLIEESGDNNAKFIRNAVRKELERLGLISTPKISERNISNKYDEIEMFDQPANLLGFYQKTGIVAFGKLIPWIEELSGEITVNDISVEFIDREYNLPELIENNRQILMDFKKYNHYKTYQTEPKLYDGSLLRLENFEWKPDEGLKLIISKTSYLKSYLSNYALDIFYNGKTLRERFSDLQLPSKLSNHFGSDIILVTRDNKIIMQRRSYSVAIHPGSLWHSLGGSSKFNAEDEIHPFNVIKQQGEEEFSTQIHDIELLGMCRDLEHGGLPVFFYRGRVNDTFSDFKLNLEKNIPEDEWEYSEIFPLEIDKIEEFVKNNISILHNPTILALYYFLKHSDNSVD